MVTSARRTCSWTARESLRSSTGAFCPQRGTAPSKRRWPPDSSTCTGPRPSASTTCCWTVSNGSGTTASACVSTGRPTPSPPQRSTTTTPRTVTTPGASTSSRTDRKPGATVGEPRRIGQQQWETTCVEWRDQTVQRICRVPREPADLEAVRLQSVDQCGVMHPANLQDLDGFAPALPPRQPVDRQHSEQRQSHSDLLAHLADRTGRRVLVRLDHATGQLQVLLVADLAQQHPPARVAYDDVRDHPLLRQRRVHHRGP